MENERRKPDNRDLDVLKIRICSQSLHTITNVLLSFEIAIFFSVAVPWTWLSIQRWFDIETWVAGLALLVIFITISIFTTRRMYKRGIMKISELIEKVKRGEALPTLSDIS